MDPPHENPEPRLRPVPPRRDAAALRNAVRRRLRQPPQPRRSRLGLRQRRRGLLQRYGLRQRARVCHLRHVGSAARAEAALSALLAAEPEGGGGDAVLLEQ